MENSYRSVVISLAAAFTVLVAAPAWAKGVVAPYQPHSTIGREVEAPPWSAACMTDHGPSECDEPMWVYGSRAAVSRYKPAF